jgi:hypothetical protein
VTTLTKVPSEHVHPVAKIVIVEEEGTYSNELENAGTTKLMAPDAEVVTSEIVSGKGKHTIMLDIDVPATLVPSTTPGHSHLYIDVPVEWDKYQALLDALVVAGVLEPGYVSAAKGRGCTALRLPWVKKK